LHYSSAEVQDIVEAQIARLGPTIAVAVSGGVSYRVPRVWIACHGIQGWTLPQVAAEKGWEIVHE
jgi:hypothetical protein